MYNNNANPNDSHRQITAEEQQPPSLSSHIQGSLSPSVQQRNTGDASQQLPADGIVSGTAFRNQSQSIATTGSADILLQQEGSSVHSQLSADFTAPTGIHRQPFGGPLSQAQNHFASLVERRRHQIVPPNNHSPKPVPNYSDHQQFNKGQISFNSDQQSINQFNLVNDNKHESQFRDTVHPNDTRGQPFLSNTNGYCSTTLPAKQNTKEWSAHSQTVRPMISANDVDSSLRNGSQNSSGLLSAFGSSTSVSAATAVANIASLINNASTSSHLPNANTVSDSQLPALAVSGQLQTAYGAIVGHGQMGTPAGYLGSSLQENQDSSLRSLPLENGANSRNQQSIMVSNLFAFFTVQFS